MTEHDQAQFRDMWGRAIEARQRFDYFLTGLASPEKRSTGCAWPRCLGLSCFWRWAPA